MWVDGDQTSGIFRHERSKAIIFKSWPCNCRLGRWIAISTSSRATKRGYSLSPSFICSSTRGRSTQGALPRFPIPLNSSDDGNGKSADSGTLVGLGFLLYLWLSARQRLLNRGLNLIKGTTKWYDETSGNDRSVITSLPLVQGGT